MLESFTLSGLGLISLDSDDLEKDDYSLLASSSSYRITKVNSVMKKKRKREINTHDMSTMCWAIHQGLTSHHI